MKSKLLASLAVFSLLAGVAVFLPCPAPAGELGSTSGYKVLAPIRHGNLTVFPVVAAHSYDTQEFLTLDEGLRSGEVIVTESGSVQPLIRRRPPLPHNGAQVNQLVLVNNSKRPLILLAGEIVTGGKQDRVIGKDRIIPAESDPIDLGVFCVEPGRWVGSSDRFGVGRHGRRQRGRRQWRPQMSAPRQWPTRTSSRSGRKWGRQETRWRKRLPSRQKRRPSTLRVHTHA